ncbi:hypothetical protein CC2G_003331 [Coprinopsis cinerea AmutBmut pab1-1]|nr:hypothetical protein CC2G_003331 [Coprinopsis cinerea AmutBmut pab1-1]
MAYSDSEEELEQGIEEDFWPIVGILAEDKKRYKVRWDGTDPKTGRPWPDSWVPKEDVTEDVEDDWNDLPLAEREKRTAEQKQLEKQKRRRSSNKSAKRASTSAVGKAKSVVTATKSTVSKARASTSTSTTAVSKNREAIGTFGESISTHSPRVKREEEPVSVGSSKPSTKQRGKKRSHDEDDEDTRSTGPSALAKAYTSAHEKPGPSKKKLKVDHPHAKSDSMVKRSSTRAQPAPPQRPKPRRAPDPEPSSDDDSELEVAAVISPQRRQQVSTKPQNASARHQQASGPRDKSKPVKTDWKGKGRQVDEDDDEEDWVDEDAMDVEDEEDEEEVKVVSYKPRPRKKKSPPVEEAFVPEDGDEFMVEEDSEEEPPARPKKSKFPGSSDVSKPFKLSDKVGPPKKPKSIKSKDKAGPSRRSKPVVESEGEEESVAETAALSRSRESHSSASNGQRKSTKGKEKAPASEGASAKKGGTSLDDHSSDEELERRTERSEASTALPPVVYDEDDIDSNAHELMYPPETDDAAASPKRNSKGKRRTDDDTDEEVPETQSLEEQSRRLVATPSRSRLITQMKPKTPSASRTPVVGDVVDPVPPPPELLAASTSSKPRGTSKQKTLHPIPQLSPSKFAQYISSQNDSTIENPDDSQQLPQSSAEQIEQFDSPEKRPQTRIAIAVATSKSTASSSVNGRKTSRRGSEADSDYWTGDVVLAQGSEPPTPDLPRRARAERLHEEFQQKRRSETGSFKGPRTTLEDIRRSRSSLAPSDEEQERQRSRSRTRSLEPQEHPPSSPPPVQDEQEQEQVVVDEEDEFGGLEYVDGPSEVPVVEVEDSFEEHQQQQTGADVTRTETQMDEDDDNDVVEVKPVQAIPEEEEESTQDLLHEMEVHKAISEGVGSPSPEPVQEPGQDQQDVEMMQDVSIIPQPGTQRRDLSPEVDMSVPGPSRPPSKAPSERRVPRHQEESQEIPATSSSNQDSSQDTNPSLDSSQPTGDKSADLKAVLSLLNVKSEEIARLEKLLADERVKVEELSKQLETSKDELVHATSKVVQQPDQSAAVVQLQAELDSTKSAYEADRIKWEEEKFRLELELKRAMERKDLADRDCASFREQYMKAYAATSELQSEKKDLQKELEIAKKQTVEGVAAIRAMFDGRLKDLKKDRDKWQRVAEFIMEKDKRTNDDIRRRAAEEPEVRRRYQKYKEKAVILEQERDNLHAVLEERDGEIEALEGSLADERTENVKLHESVKELREQVRLLTERRGSSQLSQPVVSQPVPVSQPIVAPSQPSPHLNGTSIPASLPPDPTPTDPTLVVRCQFRYPDNRICNHTFESKQDLYTHMVSVGHIPNIGGDALDNLD